MSMTLMVAAMKSKVGNPLRKLVLIKLADNANDEAYCWPSYQHISDQCEISKSTVRKHIKDLSDAGFLRIEHRTGPKGNSSNIYHLTIEKGCAVKDPMPSESIPMPSESTEGVPSDDTRTSHSFESVKEPITLPPNGSASSDDGGQCDLIPEDKETSKPEKPKKPRLNKPDNWKQFYAEYPANRRGGSDATPWEKAKKMRLTEDDFAAMLEDVKKRKMTESWRNGFVPGITKYLTEETWKVPLTWPVPSYQTNQNNTKVDVDAAMAPRAVRRQESTPEQLKRNQEQAANLLNMFKGG